MSRFLHYLDVYLQPQTYLSLVYLLLAFPLGLVYFIVLVVGFSTGFALTLIIIGIFLLILMLALTRFFILIERKMAIWFLSIPASRGELYGLSRTQSTWLKKLLRTIRYPQTWTGLLYLMLKLPIGIVVFAVVAFLLTSSFGLLASLFTYRMWEDQFWGPGILFWKIDTMAEGIIGFLLGFILLTISLHIINYLGRLLGIFTRWLLNPRVPREHPPENESSLVQ